MWKNSKDGYERNPIDPNYQVTIIAFGMDGNEDLEFLQKVREEEKKKNKLWNPYLGRLAQARAFYTSLGRNKQSFNRNRNLLVER